MSHTTRPRPSVWLTVRKEVHRRARVGCGHGGVGGDGVFGVVEWVGEACRWLFAEDVVGSEESSGEDRRHDDVGFFCALGV